LTAPLEEFIVLWAERGDLAPSLVLSPATRGVAPQQNRSAASGRENIFLSVCG